MSLQVRMRHALGERLVELPDRPADEPLVVGRSREADVKVPSVTVAPEHCVLFVHEGQWVVQDTSDGSTFVNGNPIPGPTPLFVGDVIQVGSDANPATLEVDPSRVAQGHAGQPAQSVAAAGAAPAVRAAPPMAHAPAIGYPAAPAYPAQPAAYAAPMQAGDGYAGAHDQTETPGDDGGMMDWQQAPAAPAYGSGRRAARSRKKQSSDAPLIFGVLACVAVLGVTGYFIHERLHPAVVPPVRQAAPPPPATRPDDSPKLHNIFTGDASAPNDLKTQPPGVAKTAVAMADRPRPAGIVKEYDPSTGENASSASASQPATAPATQEAVESSTEDEKARSTDRAWTDVEVARFAPNPAQAILKFDDYRHQHPGKYTKDLDAYGDEALDHLWWLRIAQLMNKQARLKTQITQKEKEIRQETNAAFKKTLTAEKKPLEDQLAQVRDRLTNDMGYTSDEVPDPANEALMKELAAGRDAGKFAEWKKRTARYIRFHHGVTEWDGED